MTPTDQLPQPEENSPHQKGQVSRPRLKVEWDADGPMVASLEFDD